MRKPTKDGRNDNLDWNDLQMPIKVTERGTSRKLVYELLLAVYSNFRRIIHRSETHVVLMLKTTFCLPHFIWI